MLLCIFAIAVNLCTYVAATGHAGDNFPRTWHVQMDSASDNKCKYVFAYFAHVVAVGGATDIEINFLMVGHTHEDIDGETWLYSHCDARTYANQI